MDDFGVDAAKIWNLQDFEKRPLGSFFCQAGELERLRGELRGVLRDTRYCGALGLF